MLSRLVCYGFVKVGSNHRIIVVMFSLELSLKKQRLHSIRHFSNTEDTLSLTRSIPEIRKAEVYLFISLWVLKPLIYFTVCV